MAVASPTKSISKSHCRINIDDWELNLEDLNSTNGTYLLREASCRVAWAAVSVSCCVTATGLT